MSLIEVYYCSTGDDSPCYAKALALRATMYTLMSQVDDAMSDIDEVINMDDNRASIKVNINHKCLIDFDK